MGEFKKAFGSRLRAQRRALDLTQEALAERLGISRNMVRGYETGEYGPEFSRLPEIAAALELDVAALFGPAEADDPATGDSTCCRPTVINVVVARRRPRRRVRRPRRVR